MTELKNPDAGSSESDWRERFFPFIWALLLPVRFYLRQFPIQRGKGILLRHILVPLQPPIGAEYELQVLGRGIVSLGYRETLGLSSLLYGTFELAELEFARSYLRPGDNALDIGANVGIFSVVMGGAVGESGRVLAFEPSPANVVRLQANLNRNGLGVVQVFPCALGGADGRMTLNLATDPAYPSLMAVESGLADGTGVLVEVRRLDGVWEEAGMPTIAFVKMDVEGAEPDVIRGASNLLQSCHPTLLVEANSPEQFDLLCELLAPFGYQTLQPKGFAPHNHLFFHSAAVAAGRPLA